MYTCSICNKSFNSLHALQGHMRVHGPSDGKNFNIMCCCLLTRKEMKSSNINKFQKQYLDYNINPNHCVNCDKPIPFDLRNRKFCSLSCSTSYTNKKRTETTKGKTKSLVCTICGKEYDGSIHTPKGKIVCNKCKTKKKPQDDQVIFGEFSKLPWRKCAHCGHSFISRRKLKYCTECEHIYSSTNKVKYKFTFNVYNYPDIFDLQKLSAIGFYAPRGKSGRWNPNGLSRDHKISVNDSIKYDYDPYYITHPMNCELMPQIDNNKKKTKSSITYQELVDNVIQYDLKTLAETESNYHLPGNNRRLYR